MSKILEDLEEFDFDKPSTQMINPNFRLKLHCAADTQKGKACRRKALAIFNNRAYCGIHLNRAKSPHS